ncbi:MAG: GyrI-like domain-containing protein [Candidatus Bathyarchaeota archaeon]|nr:MAG: GyrI-like domain-containing protein [Candidatus Bathyarchaeota archaeon]
MSDANSNSSLEVLAQSSNEIARILGTLANKKRLQLLTSLLQKTRTFRELQQTTGLGKTALAHHLKLLVESGILKHTGKGLYELSQDGSEILKSISVTYAGSKRRRELEAARRADYIQMTHTKKEGVKTKKLDIEIVKLEPMRIASVRAVSKTPEHDSWEKMRAWAEPKGLLQNIKKHPVFGFNNPDPSPGQEEYGYEFWIRVDPDTEPDENIEIKEFEGGLYAVTTCKLKDELESEFFRKEGYLESWRKIVDWVKSSKYKFGKHQCLEKAHEPGVSEEDLILDLYCPIEE